MKNPFRKGKRCLKPQPVGVSTIHQDVFIFTRLVEKVAGQRYTTGFRKERLQSGWEAIETSSLEADVRVDVNLFNPANQITIPFVTSFIFGCIKKEGEKYNLAWGSSLS
jgi:hypothetical protein